jgi:hypothetical protein
LASVDHDKFSRTRKALSRQILLTICAIRADFYPLDSTKSLKKEGSPEITPGTGDWQSAQRAAERLRQSGYDFDVWRQQREYDSN